MPRSDVETRWIKFGSIKDFIVLIDHVIAMASGIHVMFLNSATGEERIEKFDSPERGQGASCLAAHPVIPMFATAERRSSPKICIFTYPGIRKVSSCTLEGGPNGYLSCTFAGSEYLLSLTNFPEFRIIVWSWRTGENLTSIDTKVSDLSQRITCSPSPPYQVSQLGEISGSLVVHEINVCSRIVMISPTYGSAPSSMNRVVSTSWSPDGDLFECDANGKVTLNCNDGKRRHLIVHGEKDDTPASENLPSIEAFQSGIVLVDQASRIVFYRKPASPDSRVKSGTPWRSVWTIQVTSHPVFLAKIPHRDALLVNCVGGKIFELTTNDEDDSPMIRTVAYQGSKNKFLVAVNPRGDHVAVIDHFDRLNVHQWSTGRFVSNVALKNYGAVHCSVSHPNLPLIAIGTATGKFVLISLYQITQPSVIRVIHLVRESLEVIRYSWSTVYLGISDITANRLFVIGSGQDDQYSVLGLLHFDLEVIDFLIYENQDEPTKVLILAGTNRSRRAGEIIIVYCLDDSMRKECLCTIELTHVLDCLYYGRNRHEIISVPYLTKQLHLMEIQEDFQGLTLVDALSSGHQLRNIKFYMNDSFVLTCSYDGLIIARSRTNVRQGVAIFMAHHRFDGGAKVAIMSSFNDTIVSLGRNGDLVAVKICNVKSVENVTMTDPEDLASPALQSNDDTADDLTWVEREEAMQLQTEREQCAEERYSIMQDFGKLRERLKLLLDANEHECANAQLSISDFDLDRDSRARKINENVARESRLVEKLEREILQRDEVSRYLRKLCWDSMEIQACSLMSFNGKTKIDNFAMPRVSKKEEDRRRWENFLVDFRHLDRDEDTCRISAPGPFSIIGTTTDRFLPETSDRSINQIRTCPSYSEGILTCAIIKDRERKLKIRFNEMFEEMRSIKDRELTIAAQRLDEIDHCALELKNTFGINPARDNTLSQPLWHYTEIPDTIIIVTDAEISMGRAATYLERDNHPEFMRKQREENMKLNDSFREAALQVMMDGLLEVRSVCVKETFRILLSRDLEFENTRPQGHVTFVPNAQNNFCIDQEVDNPISIPVLLERTNQVIRELLDGSLAPQVSDKSNVRSRFRTFPNTLILVSQQTQNRTCRSTSRRTKAGIVKKKQSSVNPISAGLTFLPGYFRRWEDEIKKDPPRPSFLSSKDPSSYTADEIAELDLYRTKCDELDRERKKYKKMLEDKIIKVEDSLRQDFRSFDRKLEAFQLDRIRVESAILQETLMRLRESQRHLVRQRGIERIQLAREELTSAVKELRNMSSTLTSLENVVTETRNRYENLTKREKILEAKFRGEFPELKQPMVEHLLRHYRKRPRNVQLTCTSITYLTEIAKCVVNCGKSDILPRDCAEYIRGVDCLDAMPNNLPPHIDIGHWNLLCRLRRAKVELEIKIKVCAVDLAEAEQTFVSYQKSCSSMEIKVSQLRESIKDRERKNREILDDMEIQVVLKMNQVECQLSGDPSELRNAVLVPFSLVENANKAIIEAGREKLAAMRRTVVFRRTTLWHEWRHECMRIRLDNMREGLKALQGVKVTKEVQNYLNIEPQEVSGQRKTKSNDRVLASTKKRFDRILQEAKTQLDDSVRKIERWREKNRRISDRVEKMKLASLRTSTTIHDENRERDAQHRQTKIKAIMRRTRLKKTAQENYSELLALQTQLELLRLKTYPTLRLKGLPRDKRTTKKSD